MTDEELRAELSRISGLAEMAHAEALVSKMLVEGILSELFDTKMLSGAAITAFIENHLSGLEDLRDTLPEPVLALALDDLRFFLEQYKTKHGPGAKPG